MREQDVVKDEQAREIERLREREAELDDLLHNLHSEHVSLTRIYRETKEELSSVNEKLQILEKDLESRVDSREIDRRLKEQLKSELEALRLENEQRRENEEIQRKIIKDMKTVSFFFTYTFHKNYRHTYIQIQ